MESTEEARLENSLDYYPKLFYQFVHVPPTIVSVVQVGRVGPSCHLGVTSKCILLQDHGWGFSTHEGHCYSSGISQKAGRDGISGQVQPESRDHLLVRSACGHNLGELHSGAEDYSCRVWLPCGWSICDKDECESSHLHVSLFHSPWYDSHPWNDLSVYALPLFTPLWQVLSRV